MAEEELIDLNKRTQKELLLEIYKDVKGLKRDRELTEQRLQQNDITIATIKTQLRSYSLVWGTVSAAVVSLIFKLIS